MQQNKLQKIIENHKTTQKNFISQILDLRVKLHLLSQIEQTRCVSNRLRTLNKQADDSLDQDLEISEDLHRDILDSSAALKRLKTANLGNSNIAEIEKRNYDQVADEVKRGLTSSLGFNLRSRLLGAKMEIQVRSASKAEPIRLDFPRPK